MTEGPLSAGTLTVRIVSDAGHLSRDVERQVNGASKAAIGAVDKTGKTVSERARHIGGRASLFLTAPLLLGAKAAIDAGSDIVESVNKVNVVFGPAGKGVVAWSETTAKSFGISKREALDAAGTFGNLFRAMGVGTKQAAATSTQMTELAGDLASFNNADPSEVLEAMRSGLLGEAEPMRRYGVQLSETRVAAEALAEGLVKPVKNTVAIGEARTKLELATRRLAQAEREHGKGSDAAKTAQLGLTGAQRALDKAMAGNMPTLTDAQKLMARQAIITKDTALAHGDFSRSLSTSSANQERVNKALADNARATIGGQLLPMYHKALITVGHVAEAFNHLSPAAQKTIVALVGGAIALGPVLTVLGNVRRAYGGIAKGATGVVRTTTGLVRGYRNVNAAMADNASTATRVGAGVRSQLSLIGQQARGLATTAGAWLKNTGAQIANAAAAVRQRVVTLAAAAAQRAAAIASTVATLAVRGLSIAMAFLAANPIVLVITALVALAIGLVILYKKVHAFRAIVQAVFHWIAAHWPLLLAIITGPVGLAVLFVIRHFDQIKHVVGAVVGAVVGYFTGLPGRLQRGISNIGHLIAAPFEAGWAKVRGGVDRVVGFFRGLPGRIGRAVRGAFDGLWQAFRSSVNKLISGWNNLSFKLPRVNTHIPGVGKIGGWSINTPNLPLLGRGGTVVEPGGVIVGDRGPEVLELPEGANVVPLQRGEDGRGVSVNVHPAPGMDETHIGRVAAHELEWQLR